MEFHFGKICTRNDESAVSRSGNHGFVSFRQFPPRWWLSEVLDKRADKHDDHEKQACSKEPAKPRWWYPERPGLPQAKYIRGGDKRKKGTTWSVEQH
jgi:hypothetical protein